MNRPAWSTMSDATTKDTTKDFISIFGYVDGDPLLTQKARVSNGYRVVQQRGDRLTGAKLLAIHGQSSTNCAVRLAAHTRVASQGIHRQHFSASAT